LTLPLLLLLEPDLLVSSSGKMEVRLLERDMFFLENKQKKREEEFE
jgi:hypothetical protein